MSTTTTAAPSAEQAAVYALPGRIVAAWAKHDGTAFAEVFTEDGTMVLPGNAPISGRDKIAEFMSAAFAGPYQGTQVFGEPVSGKFLGPDAAVLITRGGVLQSGETEVAPERAVHAMWVAAKRDGEWQLAAYENTPVNS